MKKQLLLFSKKEGFLEKIKEADIQDIQSLVSKIKHHITPLSRDIFYIVEERDGFYFENHKKICFQSKNGSLESIEQEKQILFAHLPKKIQKALKKLSIRKGRLSVTQKYGIGNKKYRKEKWKRLKKLRLKAILYPQKTALYFKVRYNLPNSLILNNKTFLLLEQIVSLEKDIELLEKARKQLSKVIKYPGIIPNTGLFSEIESSITIREKSLSKKRNRLKIALIELKKR